MLLRKSTLVLIFALSVIFKVSANPAIDVQESIFQSSKIAIIYLSRTRNTEAVANMIQRHTSGDIFSVELKTPYPEDFWQTVKQVRQENESGYLPELKAKMSNIDEYDMVFIGFPTWGMQLPPPMKSFLTSHNMTGVSVFPFNTNMGYGIGSSFDQLADLCLGCNVKPGISFVGGVERDGELLAIKDERAVDVEDEVVVWLKSIADGLRR